jgi:endoglucanase
MMNNKIKLLVLFSFFSLITAGLKAGPGTAGQHSWIRINQLGYLPGSVKCAVFLSKDKLPEKHFQIVNVQTGKTVFRGSAHPEDGTGWGMVSAARLDFSSFNLKGDFCLKYGKTLSPDFKVGSEVFRGISAFLLRYMRQQQCGFNPWFRDSCHMHDGFIVDHPTRSGEIIDVTGGWHDATDYLQYTTTSANAVYQLLMAYKEHPEVYGDEYQANGLPGSNGIPDILDEAIWGTEWLMKMNPSYGEMYNQIADDRDHVGFRLPMKDPAKYGKGDYRPVYFVTGKSQGLNIHKNRTTGVSSTAGKFASAFAMASEMLKKINPELSEQLKTKAGEAYRFGLTDLGATQTACVVSPYFYEEENWVDDLELAAAALYELTGEENYLKDARKWGETEPVTPWMAFNRARHYQYYPFGNIGHTLLAAVKDSAISPEFRGFLREGLQFIQQRAEKDPFRMGVPFVWCSNNLVTATVTQARKYEDITGDKSFSEMEAALRDWLFGCNPWGTSMICGLPEKGDSPVRPHSSITVLTGENTLGGLVDGPVYRETFNSHIGSSALKTDPYREFQDGKAVYHDDTGDYSTNEPTMDGTAMLCWYFSWLEKAGLGLK